MTRNRLFYHATEVEGTYLLHALNITGSKLGMVGQGHVLAGDLEKA